MIGQQMFSLEWSSLYISTDADSVLIVRGVLTQNGGEKKIRNRRGLRWGPAWWSFGDHISSLGLGFLKCKMGLT